MSQLTIYLPDEIEEKARKVAKAQKKSVSRWIADQIRHNIAKSLPQAWIDAAGAFPDFPDVGELRKGYGEDAPRESLD
jgi:predicted transcriptional regulator